MDNAEAFTDNSEAFMDDAGHKEMEILTRLVNYVLVAG